MPHEACAGSWTLVITLTENVGATRSALRTCAPEGALAGAAGGVLIGAAESAWCASRTASLDDIGLLWWGPVAYGVLFTFCGLGLGCVAAFLHGALNRFRQRSVSFAFSLGGTFAAGVVTVGRWRFYADFRRGLEATLPEKALIWLVAALTAAVVWFAVSRACALTLSRMRIRQGAVLAALMGLAVLIILGGTAAATFQGHSVVPAPYHRAMDLSSPNFILIIADALRADFLKLYDLNAEAKTPFLDALAGDGILFTSCFAQGSWTKPAFGTMLTGLYPSTHTATSQFAALPEDIITLAEQLSDHAFYTCALANNANVSSCMNFDQGFVEFYDPRRSRFHFGAPPSAAQLVLYDRVARTLPPTRLLKDKYP